MQFLTLGGMLGADTQKPIPLKSESNPDQERLLLAFGTHLRQLRHEKEMTIEQLAHEAGMHHNYLSSVERGERNIALYNICRLASALGLAATELMERLPLPKVKQAATKKRRYSSAETVLR